MSCKHEPLRQLPDGQDFRWLTHVRSGMQIDIEICKHCHLAFMNYCGPITQEFIDKIKEVAGIEKTCTVCNEDDFSLLQQCKDGQVRCQACYDVWSDKG